MSDPQAFQQWWLASDKAATVDCRISAQAGWNAALVQSSADIDRLQHELCTEQAKLEAAQKRILEFENREAACCSEDWSFEEVISNLRRQRADLREACGSAVLAQHEAVKRAEKAEAAMIEEQQHCLKALEERDNAEEAMSHAYYLVTGHSPEWSSNFSYAQAHEDIEGAVNRLKHEIAALRDPTAKQEANPAFPAESPFPLK